MITRRRSYLLTGLTLLFLPVLAVGAWELAIELRFRPAVPSPDYPVPASESEARRQDIEYFKYYLDLDRSYTVDSRSLALLKIAELEARVDEVDAIGFELGIARAVAVADNGHSNIWLGRFSRKHGRIPLRLYWFSDGLYVIRVHPSQADLLGARLEAVNGIPVEEVAKVLRQYVGGTWEAFRAFRGPILLEMPAVLFAAGLTSSASESELSFNLFDGQRANRVLAAQMSDTDSPLHWPGRYLVANVDAEKPEAWASLAVTQEKAPLYQQRPQQDYQMRELPGSGLYIQYRNNRGEGIDAFGNQVRDRLQGNSFEFVVVDQRANSGGDYTMTESLMSDLPKLSGEATPIYVITGPATFSAGINSVAFLRAAGGDQVTIVGERIGDRERIYGETNDFELPNSRLGITFSTGLHDVENGCPPWPQCYWRNYLHDVAVGKLDPDLTVETRFSDYVLGHDPVLEAVLQLQSSGPLKRAANWKSAKTGRCRVSLV